MRNSALKLNMYWCFYSKVIFLYQKQLSILRTQQICLHGKKLVDQDTLCLNKLKIKVDQVSKPYEFEVIAFFEEDIRELM